MYNFEAEEYVDNENYDYDVVANYYNTHLRIYIYLLYSLSILFYFSQWLYSRKYVNLSNNCICPVATRMQVSLIAFNNQ